MPRDGEAHLVERREPQHLDLVHSPLEFRRGHERRQIQKRPSRARQPKAATDPNLVAGKLRSPMPTNSGVPRRRRTGNRHVDEVAQRSDDPPDRPSRAMAEDRPRTASHQRRLLAREPLKMRQTHQVDAPVHPVQTPCGDAAIDPTPPNTGCPEFGARHKPTARTGGTRDQQVPMLITHHAFASPQPTAASRRHKRIASRHFASPQRPETRNRGHARTTPSHSPLTAKRYRQFRRQTEQDHHTHATNQAPRGANGGSRSFSR